MTHLEKGDFAGNAASLRWSSEPDSPVKLKEEDIPSTGEPMYEVAKRVKGLKPPAVWFPHTLMGISTSGIQEDTTRGAFGPFAGQLFVADQGHSKIMRVAMEKVNGVWQGACFPFREGFQSGVLKIDWGLDGSLFVGQTSRGWGATGQSKFGIQRLVWTGDIPFEMKAIASQIDGFEVEFTHPIDPTSLQKEGDITITSFTYPYHHHYGGDMINKEEIKVEGFSLSADQKKLRLVVNPEMLRKGYIHEVKSLQVRSKEGLPLLHTIGYYTLNEISPTPKVNKSSLQTLAASYDHSQHTTTSTAEVSSNKNTTAMPSSWGGKADATLELGSLPGLKFDKTQLSVKAGSKVKLVFHNNDDMLHNVVITNPKMGEKVGAAALELGLKGGDLHYVPLTEDVLFHTKVIQPNRNETLYFTAPKKAGEYDFLCTFPGHHLFMKGILKVTP
jgi:azurin